jgi:hypothetical protein
MSINMNQPYRRSLVGPFILIGIGVLFLMHNLVGFDLIRIIRSYWPLILIVIGLWKLFEYYRVNKQVSR